MILKKNESKKGFGRGNVTAKVLLFQKRREEDRIREIKSFREHFEAFWQDLFSVSSTINHSSSTQL